MDQSQQEAPTSRKKASQPARSLRIAEKGIRTAHDFAGFMSALISDIVSRRVSPEIGGAACNAGGKLLKVVEMQYKFGGPNSETGDRTLQLVSGE